jgi:hypothetical protein
MYTTLMIVEKDFSISIAPVRSPTYFIIANFNFLEYLIK